MNWGLELYDNKTYDKCTQQEGKCFISLKSLEKDYGYDISLFKAKGASCSLEKSGLYFENEESDIPFSDYLSGCKFLESLEKNYDENQEQE